MKPFNVLFWIVFAGIVVYFGFRIVESTQLPHTLNITHYAPIKALTPAACHFSSTSSSRAVVGDMYVLNGITRFKYIVTSGQTSLLVSVLVNQEGTAFAWNEGAHEGLFGGYEAVALRLGLTTIGTVSCGPWWIPDPFLMYVPSDVKFQDVGQLG